MAVINKLCLGQVNLAGSATDTYTLTASPLTANVQQQTVRVLCDTSTGVVSVTLPEIATFKGLYQELTIIVADTGSNATTNNIGVQPATGDTIEGTAVQEILKDNKVLTLKVAADGLWDLLNNA